MSENRCVQRVSVPMSDLPTAQVEGFDVLAGLALDMRWSWNHATDNVWRRLNPDLWDITHNPWVVLQTASRDEIERLLADQAFRATIDGLVQHASGGWAYGADVSATRPPSDYTARVIPQRDGVAVPLEFDRIVWQR